MNVEQLKLLAKDLTREYPRSPRDTLGGYVVAARCLDKCRALLNGSVGEYRFDGYLDGRFFEFAGIDAGKFKDVVATGATDDEVAAWIQQNATARPRIDVIKWNNRMREMKISDLPDKNQEFMETYIPRFTPKDRRFTGGLTCMILRKSACERHVSFRRGFSARNLEHEGVAQGASSGPRSGVVIVRVSPWVAVFRMPGTRASSPGRPRVSARRGARVAYPASRP